MVTPVNPESWSGGPGEFHPRAPGSRPTERPDLDGQRRDRHRAGARAELPAASGWPGGPSVPSPGLAAGGARGLPRAIAAGPGNRMPRRDTHGGLGRGGYEDVMIR